MNPDNQYASSVTLIILGDGLVPEDVSESLAIEPSRSWKKGDERRNSSSAYPWGGWKCFGEDANITVEEKIESWTTKLKGKSTVFKKLKEEGCRCSLDVFVAFEEVATLRFTSELSARVSDLYLDLDLCLNTDTLTSEPVGI